VVITQEPDSVPLIQALGDPRVLQVTVGDPSDADTLGRAGVKEAITVVAASDDDTQNLIIALEIKRTNPYARIVVSTKRGELRSTLTASGVTYVASPFEMSGRLMASAAFEPEVARLVDDVTSGADDYEAAAGADEGYDMQQFTLPPTSALCNNTVGYLRASLKQISGPLLLAIAKHMGEGNYKLYPHPAANLVMNPYDSLVVLGNKSQNGRVAQYLGVVQGR
jgi:Trk K+ transport system NAD-binding subunit